jgi:uncharacterized protein YcaQ
MEEAADLRAVAEALTTELSSLAAWLGLDRVEIARRGDLAPALRAQAKSGGRN